MTESERAQYLRQGVRRLRQWMPACRARVLTPDEPEVTYSFESMIAKAQQPHVREKNLEALLIWPGERGGWIVDMVLRNVPPGIANTLGTPVQTPWRTEVEAEDHGRRLLEMALLLAHQNEKSPEPKPFEQDVSSSCSATLSSFPRACSRKRSGSCLR